jgi:hypothetical protein
MDTRKGASAGRLAMKHVNRGSFVMDSKSVKGSSMAVEGADARWLADKTWNLVSNSWIGTLEAPGKRRTSQFWYLIVIDAGRLNANPGRPRRTSRRIWSRGRRMGAPAGSLQVAGAPPAHGPGMHQRKVRDLCDKQESKSAPVHQERKGRSAINEKGRSVPGYQNQGVTCLHRHLVLQRISCHKNQRLYTVEAARGTQVLHGHKQASSERHLRFQ